MSVNRAFALKVLSVTYFFTDLFLINCSQLQVEKQISTFSIHSLISIEGFSENRKVFPSICDDLR